MKTARDWAEQLIRASTDSGMNGRITVDAITKIQNDAIREGMRQAAKVKIKPPIHADTLTVEQIVEWTLQEHAKEINYAADNLKP